MAGILDITVANYLEVFVSTDLTASPPSAPAYALLENVQSVGEMTDESTIIDIPAYGSRYLSKVVGSANAGPIELVVSLDPTAAIQILMRQAYEANTKLTFEVRMGNSASTVGTTYDSVEFVGYVASATIANEFDAIRTQTFSIAVDGALGTLTAAS